MDNEEENISMLQSMMGDLDAGLARRTLLKHSGNIDAAATELLDLQAAASAAGKVDESTSSWPMNLESELPSYSSSYAPQRPNTPHMIEPQTKQKDVIDLTGDMDPDLSRALQMSLDEDDQKSGEELFRPSARTPDPNWAMVPSNAPVAGVQEQEDQSLTRAIEASLTAEDRYEEYPNEDKIRKPGYPVALRTRKAYIYHAPLILQALFHVPQIRQLLASWHSDLDTRPHVWRTEQLSVFVALALKSLFTFMDLALWSQIPIDGLELWESLAGQNATQGNPDRIGRLSNDFYSFVALCLESMSLPRTPSDRDERLFHLRYALAGAQPNDLYNGEDALSGSDLSEMPCVKVDIRSSDGPNDLISCLSSQIGFDRQLPPSIVTPSTIIAFELVRSGQVTFEGPQTASPAQGTPFRYPTHVFLDQFLQENAAITEQKRQAAAIMRGTLIKLNAKKERLTRFAGNDTLESLTSAVYYYEKVASKTGINSEDRSEQIKATAMSLRKVLIQVENEVEATNTEISKLHEEMCELFDDPLFQKHRYDLRAVLVHDGLFGRNHIHSFVRHNDRWFRTQDANVVEVSEEVVLTDATGLHLGAGPYLLIYSRACEDVDVRAQWPAALRNNVLVDNNQFIREIEESAPKEAVMRLRAIAEDMGLEKIIATEDQFEDIEIEEGDVVEELPAGIIGQRRSMSAMSIVEESQPLTARAELL